MKNENVNTEQSKEATVSVKKRDAVLFTGAAVGKIFNKV